MHVQKKPLISRLALPLLISALLHALVISIVWLIPPKFSTPPGGNKRLNAKLVYPGQPKVAWSPYDLPRTPDKQEVGVSEAMPYPAYRMDENSAEPVANDEVYLPRELLSKSATPRDEIDLQDIVPPGKGSFRMRLWIDRHGTVNQVDIQDSDTPAWFSEQIADKFRQAPFSAGIRNEKPIASILDVEVSF